MDMVMNPQGRHAEVNSALLKQFGFDADRDPDTNCRCGAILLVGFEEDNCDVLNIREKVIFSTEFIDDRLAYYCILGSRWLGADWKTVGRNAS